MSYRGLSDLHFIQPKQTVNALYYVSDILEGTCLNTLKRRRINGPVYSRKLVLKRSEEHFMQDGAPAHKGTQEWCKSIFQAFGLRMSGLVTH